ncbi:hypothetical protein C5167_024504 [Papaver somniferum]|uniref:Uncharacterized protein n=1 Tax=Papaver somniferum TaxID=3469 RepID=A0A4Y7JSE0_PAPSO|nr:protein STICHEL-like 2 [Papaver somniferum]RZC62728.1 hypothetical protein C5167_024504 [Papaver somniferum]
MDSDEKFETGESSNKQVMKNQERSSSSLADCSKYPIRENPTKGTYRRSSSMSLPKEFADAAMELAIKRALSYEREDEKSISILKPASVQSRPGSPWQFLKIRKGMRRRKFINSGRRKASTDNGLNEITTLKGKNLQDQNSSSDEDSRDEPEPVTPDIRTDFSASAFSSCEHNTQGIAKNKESKCFSSKGLSKKYQPKLFEDVIGHEIIVKALSSAVRTENITPLYLLHGPSGTGKTSVARIFAMALNCESTSCTKPCWSCICCSRSLYIMDLCTGSRTAGFQRIRTLLQSTTFIKTVSGFKVFIIEECHTLLVDAWEEILDVAETGDSTNIVFIMITDNVSTMPKAILSRCQKFCFSNLKDMDINLKLARIVAREKIGIERDAMRLVICKAQGSMREAENILDQLILLGSKITTSMVQQIVGLVPHNKLLDLLKAAISSDTIKAARSTRELIVSGVQPQTLISQLSSLITVILSGASEAATSSSATSLKDKRLLRNGSQLTNNQSRRLSHALKILVETEKQLSLSNDQTTWVLEALLQIASEQAPNRISTDIVSTREPSDGKYATANKEHTKITINNQQTSTESLLYETEKCSSTIIRREADFMQLGNMEDVWQSMLWKVQNGYVKKLLCQQVKLASLTICSGNAIVHLIFEKAEDKLAAQMSEGTISEALRNAFGRPVTVNMSLEPTQLKIIQEPGASTDKSQVDCGHARQWQGSPHLPTSDSPGSPNVRSVVMGRSKSQKSSCMLENNLRPTKLPLIIETSQSRETNSPGEQEARIARPQQVLPFSGILTPRGGHASMDHGTDQWVREGSPRVATDFMKATKSKLSLASVQNGDASVEQYSQDLLFENANMGTEKMERRNSKMYKDQQLQQKGPTKVFSRSWSCNEIFCRETKVRSSTA